MAIHHVSLEVTPAEVERTVEFWTLVGFERVEAPGEISEYVTWLERDGHQVHLIHTPEPVAPTLGHTAVVAPDMESTMGALSKAGFGVEEARPLWGERRAFAIAPAGHRVELMAAPPPASGSRGGHRAGDRRDPGDP